ncbi:MAG TPA: FHA domain-containing protein [Streptosporangiales bacterium]
MDTRERPAQARLLPTTHSSLAFGVPVSARHTLYALALTGGITVGPEEGCTIRFGRNRPDVDVCVGEDDRKVSRQQGTLTRENGRWWLRNTGRLPLRLPARLLFAEEEPLPLDEGYTPLFVRGSNNREHLLEVYVTGSDGTRPATRYRDVTDPPRTWRLTPDERLVLVALGQRYLLHHPRPHPLTWAQTAEILDDLYPDAGWTAKRVEHLVVAVRNRLSHSGVPGLTREEVGQPVGNTLNDNLIRELLLSTTLVPPDLDLLDDEV